MVFLGCSPIFSSNCAMSNINLPNRKGNRAVPNFTADISSDCHLWQLSTNFFWLCNGFQLNSTAFYCLSKSKVWIESCCMRFLSIFYFNHNTIQFLCNLDFSPPLLAILATFHPYWSLVEGIITTWATPYGVITLSQCNTWICEPILKCTCAKKVRYSENVPFLSHCRIFHTLCGFRGGFKHHPQGSIWGHIS